MDRDGRLRDFYAESARRWETAKREFAQRTHGWRFALAPDAAQWADSHAAGERWSSSGTAAVLGVLRSVVESFATVSAFSQAPTVARR